MNRKDQKQLKACILNDLVRGKQANSPTRDLLKQYTPLVLLCQGVSWKPPLE
jgi:hypothetical protein